MLSEYREHIQKAYRMSEEDSVAFLAKEAEGSYAEKKRIYRQAKALAKGIQKAHKKQAGLEAFMSKYQLSSQEGIALMCLSEALLRIPDADTRNELIRDKLGNSSWNEHVNKENSLFVNAMTWGLVLTGRLVDSQQSGAKGFMSTLTRWVSKAGMPVVRLAVDQMIKWMSQQFVMGEDIEQAIKRAKETEAQGYTYSYDMLGEAARTAEDAERYFQSYRDAIAAVGKQAKPGCPFENAGVSIKLSALFPRYDFRQAERAKSHLTAKLLSLAQQAKACHINLIVDAEEADRLDLSLDIFEKVFSHETLTGWEGFGLAVQSYQKRAWFVLDWLEALSKANGRKICVRLIKGAYWDTEIKASQELGAEDYPVFTQKVATDISFLACARKIAHAKGAFYPMFATHNAHSVASILEFMKGRDDYEFQCLHGMGPALYDQVVGEKGLNQPCRVYAPVGVYADLLAYLVRRLLENGANTSFVKQISESGLDLEDLIQDPVAQFRAMETLRHPKIPLPQDIYGAGRLNSKGVDVSDRSVWEALSAHLQTHRPEKETIKNPSLKKEKSWVDVVNPSNPENTVACVPYSTEEDVEVAVTASEKAFSTWSKTPVTERAGLLRRVADLLEEDTFSFVNQLVYEAGKTIEDAVAEVREAIDFCRYYACEAERLLGEPQVMPGPTGELNALSLHPRGVVVCISPWNFPLAIFLGQVVAALVTGNTVLAKPAEQTPEVALKVAALFEKAGVPEGVFQCVLGKGSVVGAQLIETEATAAVMFTGSTETARRINQTLAEKEGPIIPLIAETGGLNTMVVGSSALPEQVVEDVVLSAFGSAGQRCSALRVLFLQEEVADKIIHMLKGAMAELSVGAPQHLSTDVGPVIDEAARAMLRAHREAMSKQGKLIAQVPHIDEHQDGYFFTPCAFEIDSIQQLEREVFGPILHVVRYKKSNLPKILQEIRDTGYGLTMGIHSRIESFANDVYRQMPVGNTYVNRNTTGAVVGVQPFGGEGLSGTGPKAGGPHYLLRLCTERTLTINTTAAGGNATLLSL